MDGWAIYISGTSAGENTPYEYPGTSTFKIQYFAMYQIYILVAKGHQMIVTGVYLRREVYTRARTALQLPRPVALDQRKIC